MFLVHLFGLGPAQMLMTRPTNNPQPRLVKEQRTLATVVRARERKIDPRLRFSVIMYDFKFQNKFFEKV